MADKPTAQPVRLTPDEKRLYGQLFRIADSGQIGVVTGSVAVEFFKKSRLTPAVLAEVWTIADTENQGFLTQKTWSIALRLIAHAQQGENPTPEIANRPGPPFPTFEGVQLPSPPSQQQQQPSSPVLSNRIPQLNQGDRERYRNLFTNAPARDGLLDGEQARTIFLRARLPNETLGQIWSLTDTHTRGALDITEFTVAMHLIQLLMSNRLSAVPATLPPELWASAASGSQSKVRRTDSMSSSGSGRNPPQVPPKIQQSPIRPDFTGGSQTGPDGWDITPQDKATFDKWFATIDTGNAGYIGGNDAVTFFLSSKLPEDLLAHVWDLSDIQKQGKLTRDTFAVAMYLIRLKISGRDLPAALPPSLIPPSMRQAVPAPTPAPLAQAPFAQPPPPSAAQDLFGLDEAFGSPIKPVSPPSVPRITSPSKPAAPSPKPASPVVSIPLSRPFQPKSDFGKGITSPLTETTIPSIASSQLPSIFNPAPAPFQVDMQSGSVFGDQQDLLGDADPEINQKLTAETAELANLSNQIGSLNTATRDLQVNKARAETELASVSQQKRDIEARLKQIRSLYDAEVSNVKAVETQLSSERAELGKNRQEVTVLEASLHALQAQLADQRTTLQKDQAENASLRLRIGSTGEEIKQLKETLEKAKRDARQQRGMVAINKKQLSTMETERYKIQEEIATEKKAMEALAAEAAVSVPRDITSPVGSERSQTTNPFLRMQSTGGGEVNAFSPPPQTFSPFSENTFNSAFDNAFPAQAAVSVPPTASVLFPPMEKPEPSFAQQNEAILEQASPPSIASALSPPLAARDSPAYAESATSSLAVNPSRSGVGSLNGDNFPHTFEDIPKNALPSAEGVVDTSLLVSTPPTQEGHVESKVEETEAKASDAPTPPPEHLETNNVETATLPHHGLRSTSPVRSSITVQETLNSPPRDEDLIITSPEPIPKDTTAPEIHPTEKMEAKEDEHKGVGISGGFPSNDSDEGRESWVDLGDESKSLPSEQLPVDNSLPPNRSDPFAFSTSSVPPRQATKEDFDAAFSSFANFGKKEENGLFKRDFNAEFPPIEEFGGDESDSEDEIGGFKDHFSDVVKETVDANGSETTAKNLEAPPQEAPPIAPQTEAKSTPSITLQGPAAPLADQPPPLPPKDTFRLSNELPPLPSTHSQVLPPEDKGENPPAYLLFSNLAETSSGSNDLSGLLPRREEPHVYDAPYTSPPQEPFSTPTAIAPAQPTSFSPTPPATELKPSTPPSFATPISTEKSPSPKPQPSSSFTPPAPAIEESKSAPTNQSFAAFDFSGLQDAAPLDESHLDPFRLSTRSDVFGEFDTSFDSTPVTPAKQPAPAQTQQNSDFNDFKWETPPEFSSPPVAASQQPATNFDDVFASFDRPVRLTPPTLPERRSSADDDPNLKTLKDMGFPREKALKALEKYNYNLTQATNYLLEH